ACIPEVPPPVVSRATHPRTKTRFISPSNPSKELSRWDCLAAGYSSEGLKHKHQHHNDAYGSNKGHHYYDSTYSAGWEEHTARDSGETNDSPTGQQQQSSSNSGKVQMSQEIPAIPIPSGAGSSSSVSTWNPVPGGAPAAAVVVLNPEALRELSWIVPSG
ncbi:hypothetical protein Pmar_PMAR008163, partial [Perkinsus marinus ATCC 50983]